MSSFLAQWADYIAPLFCAAAVAAYFLAKKILKKLLSLIRNYWSKTLTSPDLHEKYRKEAKRQLESDLSAKQYRVEGTFYIVVKFVREQSEKRVKPHYISNEDLDQIPTVEEIEDTSKLPNIEE